MSSNYQKYTPAQRKAWGRKMAAARAAKVSTPARPKLTGYGAYSKKAAPKTKVVYRDRPAKEEKGVGERVGSTIGAGIGKGLHQLFKAVTGFGDYSIQENSLMGGGLSPPEIINSVNEGGVIVRHREYIGDINATVNFTLQSYPLNPGLSSSFPWLSSVASSFEQYRWRGLIWEFRSLSSDSILSASTSTALGAVIMATEYNSLNADFANKSEMENHEFSNSRKPSVDFMHPVECKNSLTSVDLLYVRTGNVPSGGDIRLYDIGKTQIATVGMQAASGVCGELWVTYEIFLTKPSILSSIPPPSIDGYADRFRVTNNSVDGANPFGTGALSPLTGSNIGGSLNYSTRTYTFPTTSQGKAYMMVYAVIGTAAVITQPTINAYGVVGENLLPAGSTCSAPQNAIAAVTNYTLLYTFTVANPIATVNFGSAGVVPTAANMSFYIIEIPTGFTFKDDIKQLTPPDDTSIEDEDEIPDAIKRFLGKKGIKL